MENEIIRTKDHYILHIPTGKIEAYNIGTQLNPDWVSIINEDDSKGIYTCCPSHTRTGDSAIAHAYSKYRLKVEATQVIS